MKNALTIVSTLVLGCALALTACSKDKKTKTDPSKAEPAKAEGDKAAEPAADQPSADTKPAGGGGW